MGIKLTASLRAWMWKFHRKELPLLYFGHLEIFTEEYKAEYLKWLETDEGKSYLVGGANYSEPR